MRRVTQDLCSRREALELAGIAWEPIMSIGETIEDPVTVVPGIPVIATAAEEKVKMPLESNAIELKAVDESDSEESERGSIDCGDDKADDKDRAGSPPPRVHVRVRPPTPPVPASPPLRPRSANPMNRGMSPEPRGFEAPGTSTSASSSGLDRYRRNALPGGPKVHVPATSGFGSEDRVTAKTVASMMYSGDSDQTMPATRRPSMQGSLPGVRVTRRESVTSFEGPSPPLDGIAFGGPPPGLAGPPGLAVGTTRRIEPEDDNDDWMPPALRDLKYRDAGRTAGGAFGAIGGLGDDLSSDPFFAHAAARAAVQSRDAEMDVFPLPAMTHALPPRPSSPFSRPPSPSFDRPSVPAWRFKGTDLHLKM
ncbi:hypothetical protein BC829DRAFT_263827 [Chytridium lagenaria]|nr:hypothetical protein BC829DRAFT_263827 [Chytridium lagenaria]